MKFVAIIEYGDAEKVKALHPVHREYLRRYLENEQLRAAGPFADDAGALWVLDAETAEAAEQIVKGDPYVEAGAIVSWKIRPLAYCSAQQSQGFAIGPRPPRCTQLGGPSLTKPALNRCRQVASAEGIAGAPGIVS